MPPEPLSWDRKDFSRERKFERSSSENLGGGGSARWRDALSHHHRWGSAEFRRPTGYGKQRWNMFAEDSSHGFGPSMSSDKIHDEESCQQFGKYGRSSSSRENLGASFSPRDLKGHCWDAAASALRNFSARNQSDVNEKRSADDMLTCNSHPHLDIVNNWDQIHFKDQHNKNGGVGARCTDQELEKENLLGSINWKPLKWTRTGSLCSRGSGFSYSSSSKSMAVDSSEIKTGLHPLNASPEQRSFKDAATCATSVPAEETSSRKKPRLGWGEGLAKYEMKKVDGPEDSTEKKGMVIGGSSVVPAQSPNLNMVDRSPRVEGFPNCGSPATSSSVACSSSPALEDKPFVKEVDVDNVNLCGSSFPESHNRVEGLAFNLEKSGVTEIANLSSSLSKLLQTDDPSSVDFGFVRSTAMNKLLVVKADISKKLEVTESEIDLLENELKMLNSDISSVCPLPASSSSLSLMCILEPSDNPGAISNGIPRLAPLELNSSGGMSKEKTLDALEGELAESKDEHNESPGTAASDFARPTSLKEPLSQCHDRALKHGECSGNGDASGTEDVEMKSSVYAVNEEDVVVVASSNCIASNSCHMLSTDDVQREDMLCDLIVASNKSSAHRASEVFSKLLPANVPLLDISRFNSGPCMENNTLVKDNFAMRKRFLRFKERVITLKFRAFQHLWREDLRLLSLRRSRAKSHKKCDSSSRMVYNINQKHRSSIHSRYSSPAGNLSLVPTEEVVNFTNKLLADSHVKQYRRALKMPALVLDRKERRFVSNNGLVEDPCAAEKERCMINPWTSKEIEVFLVKLADFGKDFRKIASFLDHKTTADCVEFYYKNHKSDFFQRPKKRPEFAMPGKSCSSKAYLVTSAKRWNRDINAAALDMLGAASAVAANADGSLKDQKKCATRFFGTTCEFNKWGDDRMLKPSSSLDVFGDQRETEAVDVLAGMCGSLSSEAMSSCITSSIDFGNGYHERKSQSVGSSVRRPLTSNVTHDDVDETYSDESCGEMDPTDWTDEEKSIFIQAVASYGKDFSMISRCIRTRSREQCKVFFSKARKCLGLDTMCPGPGNMERPASDTANGGGGSEIEDACLVETSSVLCNGESGSKMPEDPHVSDLKINDDEIHPDLDQSEEDNRTGELDMKDTENRSEVIVSGDSAEDKVDLDIDGDRNIKDTVGRVPPALQVHETEAVTSDSKAGQTETTEHGSVEDSVTDPEANDYGEPSISAAESEIKAKGVEIFGDQSRAVNAGQELPSPDCSLNAKQGQIADDLEDLNAGNCCVEGMRTVPSSVGDASLSVDVVPLVGDLPQHEYRNVDSFSDVTTNCLLQDPPLDRHKRSLASKFDSGKFSAKQSLDSATRNECNQYLCGDSSLGRVDPSQILRGYPVSMSTKTGMNGDIICGGTASPQIDSRKFHPNHASSQDWHLKKCNGSKHDDTGAEFDFLSYGQSKVYPRPKPQCSSDLDKPNRNGDVKLFGQILSNTSTQQKSISRAQEKDDRVGQHAKVSDGSVNQKFTGNRNVDGILASAKFDRSNPLRFENHPMRSFGYWDGNRIQTGLPLPDSAILLAKYPAAFSNYPMPSPRIEQPHHLHSVASSNYNSSGKIVFPTREVSINKGVASYQAYRNQNVTKPEPYMVDLKQRQDLLFSEMQRRGSEFNAVSGMQPQARDVGGTNVMGRGGILAAGGPCTVVSDPVAALRMHYARTDQYVRQPRSVVREDDSWRGHMGDIGSR